MIDIIDIGVSIIISLILISIPVVIIIVVIREGKIYYSEKIYNNQKAIIDILKSHYIIQQCRNYIIDLNIPLISSIKSEIIINELLLSDKYFKDFYNINVNNYIDREKANNDNIIYESLYYSSPVEIKNNLYKKYNIDITVIDDIVKNLEREFVDSIELGLKRNNYVPDLKPKNIQQVMKGVTKKVNQVYSNIYNDILNILEFGIYNFDIQDIELYKKRNDTIKYYNIFQNDITFKNEIEYYFSQVLLNSIYPSLVTKNFEIEYIKENQILVINYSLPNIENLPKNKELKYVSTNKELKNVLYKEKEIEVIYENVIYQIVLRTLYEIFVSDTLNEIKSVVFNGVLNFVDKSDGKRKSAFTLSIHAKKEEFLDINLDKVDVKQCFKKLKGISANHLYDIVPIRPILNLNKEDKRFIKAKGVIEELDEGYNLATMDWKEFEYLVREIFEKEFSKNGGEVKVTQSSRDGGVDAIAFDPDPIRGGKIVIQAKRYSNVVGVSAVRDLYGTVLNEGATKGILVTTSDYGKDSFDFAKDKPLTLLNGANLLSLLESHGYKAKIDINEAKKQVNK